MISVGRGSIGFLITSIIVLAIMGSVLEGLPGILVFGPLLLPVSTSLGMNGMQFGILIILAMGIGRFAPPVGIGTYVACSVAGIDIERGNPSHDSIPDRASICSPFSGLCAKLEHLAAGAAWWVELLTGINSPFSMRYMDVGHTALINVRGDPSAGCNGIENGSSQRNIARRRVHNGEEFEWHQSHRSCGLVRQHYY